MSCRGDILTDHFILAVTAVLLLSFFVASSSCCSSFFLFSFLLSFAATTQLIFCAVFLLFLLQMQEFWNTGVLTAKTRCWAQGMDGWRPLQAIPQLKWCLLATGQAVMNESDLATLILNMLITMCSYYPSRWCSRKYLCGCMSRKYLPFYTLYTVSWCCNIIPLNKAICLMTYV